MECDEVSTWLDAYIDRELDPQQEANLRAHAAECPRCTASIAERESLRAAIASAPRRPAPDPLRQSVSQLSAEQHPASLKLTPRTPRWAWASLAATLLLASSTFFLLWSRPGAPSAQDLLLREALSAHIRSLMVAHLTDVPSTDQHTVKPWFAGKLDFSPPVTDHAADGFPLTGGRLDYLAGRPVAALIYTKRAHVINLFTCPDPSGTAAPERKLEDRGYHALTWSDGATRFCAVSDVNTEDLGAFVQLIKADTRGTDTRGTRGTDYGSAKSVPSH